jgi:beta-glucanase (GH16 family)
MFRKSPDIFDQIDDQIDHIQAEIDPGSIDIPVEEVATRDIHARRFVKPLAIALAGLTLFGCSDLGSKQSKKTAIEAPSSTTTTIPEGPPQTNPNFATYPTWSQDFTKAESKTLNTKFWNVFQGAPPANSESEYYTSNSQNINIFNGSLNLTAQVEHTQNYNYTSARIDTSGKEEFLYGRIDVVATMPNGVGTWPAIWMLSQDNKYEDQSAPSDPSKIYNDGEIDIAEEVGILPNKVYGIVHNRAAINNPGGQGFYNTVDLPNNDTVFNDYSIEWTPNNITFSVNNNPYFTYNKLPGSDFQTWPFDQKFYLIINLALGGTWGGGDKAQFPPDGVDKSALPATMKVQSVNYYPYIGPVNP